MPSKQIPFDIHETVILLDLYLQGEADGVPIMRTAICASQMLRMMALNRGMHIDDSFRSVKGVAGRLITMKATFTGQSKPSITSVKLFQEVVQIYRTDPERYKTLLKEARQIMENRDDSLPDALLSNIEENYPHGFRMDEITLHLLEISCGYVMDSRMRKILQKSLFHRRDDVYFLVDSIAGKATLENLDKTVHQYLDAYSCFELTSIYRRVFEDISSTGLRDENDFEDFLRFLFPKSFRIGNVCQIRLARRTDKTLEQCVTDIVERLLNVIGDNCIPIDELEEQFPAFSSSFICKLLTKEAVEVILTSVNDIPCLQSIRSLGLDEEFSDLLKSVLEEIHDLRLEPTPETLNALISSRLHTNFKLEYNIPNGRAFQKVIALYDRSDPPHVWKSGRFVEEARYV